ncbi:TPA: site-specific DNA-methyltransferase [Haemophilus influenzae]|uniref:site-specific DNA-methyltransferase n=1 Tax=Haemophilus influenzae TaxID=727 RepID=UPI001F411F32|nr:site-specific DNA-methyltransferase [Haemophilus influenzae]
MTEIAEEILFSSQTQPENEKLIILKHHFPNCFDKQGVFLPEKMAEALQSNGIKTEKESYSLNWLGKSYAKILKDRQPETLLAEDIEHNQKPENQNSENVLIQGDNLEVLKHLKHAYKNQIKMIYIDPPYNTGSDGFVYQDDRKFTPQQLVELGMDLEEAERVLEFTAKKSNSHSAWLTFMYPRLKVAHDLLKDDGVIFISIDDNEQAQLKLLCDEVFGEENFINIVSVNMKNIAGASGGGEDKRLKKNVESLLIYAKSYDNFPMFKNIYDYIEIGELIQHYKNEEKSWKYTSVLVNAGNANYIGSTIDGDGNEIKIFTREDYKISSVSALAKEENKTETEIYNKYSSQIFQTAMPQTSIRPRVMEKVKQLGVSNNLYSIEYIPRSGRNKGKIYEQFYKGDNFRLFAWLKDVSEKIDGVLYKKEMIGTYWDFVSETKNLTKEGGVPYPNGKKPMKLIKQLAYMVTEENDLILDFFAGSGTTGHSIMHLNTEDLGNRQFILVQINENLDSALSRMTGEAKKALENLLNILDEVGRPHYISEVTQERLIRSAKQIRSQNPDYTGDLGFKIFKTEPHFQTALNTDFDPQIDFLPKTDLNDKQLHTLLTTWRVFDGCRLPEKVQNIDLVGYTAYYCRQHLYLLASGFTSENVKALIERLDNDKDFVPERIVLFGENIDSVMQKELAQAVKTYANKKGLNNLSVLARY